MFQPWTVCRFRIWRNYRCADSNHGCKINAAEYHYIQGAIANINFLRKCKTANCHIPGIGDHAAYAFTLMQFTIDPYPVEAWCQITHLIDSRKCICQHPEAIFDFLIRTFHHIGFQPDPDAQQKQAVIDPAHVDQARSVAAFGNKIDGRLDICTWDAQLNRHHICGAAGENRQRRRCTAQRGRDFHYAPITTMHPHDVCAVFHSLFRQSFCIACFVRDTYIPLNPCVFEPAVQRLQNRASNTGCRIDNHLQFSKQLRFVTHYFFLRLNLLKTLCCRQ